MSLVNFVGRKKAFLLKSQIKFQITFVLLHYITSNSGFQVNLENVSLCLLRSICNQVQRQFFHNFEVRSQGKFVKKLELITCVTTFLSLHCGWSFTDCFLKHRGRYYLSKKSESKYYNALFCHFFAAF